LWFDWIIIVGHRNTPHSVLEITGERMSLGEPIMPQPPRRKQLAVHGFSRRFEAAKLTADCPIRSTLQTKYPSSFGPASKKYAAQKGL
jgi:hypothetical protein